MIFPPESKRKCGSVFSLDFLFGCCLPWKKKKIFIVRRKMLRCWVFTSYLLSNYGIFKISTQQKKISLAELRCVTAVYKWRGNKFWALFAKSFNCLQFETTPIVGLEILNAVESLLLSLYSLLWICGYSCFLSLHYVDFL